MTLAARVCVDASSPSCNCVGPPAAPAPAPVAAVTTRTDRMIAVRLYAVTDPYRTVRLSLRVPGRRNKTAPLSPTLQTYSGLPIQYHSGDPTATHPKTQNIPCHTPPPPTPNPATVFATVATTAPETNPMSPLANLNPRMRLGKYRVESVFDDNLKKRVGKILAQKHHS